MKPFQLFRHPVFILLIAALPSCILAQNVGIGTTTPQEKLHIANGDLLIGPSTGGLINTAESFNPVIKLRARPNTSDTPLGVSFGLEFLVNSTSVGSIKAVNPALLGLAPPHIRISRSSDSAPDLVVTDDGRTGIGTFSPSQKLHLHNGNFLINKTSADGIVEIGLQRGGQNRGFIQLSGSDGEHLRIGTFSGTNGNFVVRTGGGDRLTVNPTGNVAIGGSFATDYRLSVAGKIICTELRVALTNSWPDYVFEKDYHLTSLEKIENHIRKHKHLPNIPPASKLSQDGLYLGEMQRLQMEKIEELFLHVIALKKEIETVKAENEALKAEKH